MKRPQIPPGKINLTGTISTSVSFQNLIVARSQTLTSFINMTESKDLEAFDPKTTAFLLSCPSKCFKDQADRLPLFQIPALLVHVGVPAAHLWVDLPCVLGETVDEPRAHPDCPKLLLPEGVAPLYERHGPEPRPAVVAGLAQWDNVALFLQDMNNDPTVAKLVWIYLNHGLLEGLCFPGLTRPRRISADDLARVLLVHITKPTLIIIDACQSGRLAEKILGISDDFKDVPVAFLTSADHHCRSSAIVLSTEPTDRLPATIVEHPPGSGKHVRLNYRVGHPMFTRAWLREVVYGKGDVSLRELARRLQRPDAGFEADFRTKSALMEEATLRSFFPGPIKASDVVKGYSANTPISFGEVILAEEVGELYDDRGGRGAYVLLKSTADEALRDRSPTSPAVRERGLLFEDVLDVARTLFNDKTRGGRGDIL
jgi:hypothetical protein